MDGTNNNRPHENNCGKDVKKTNDLRRAEDTQNKWRVEDQEESQDQE